MINFHSSGVSNLPEPRCADKAHVRFLGGERAVMPLPSRPTSLQIGKENIAILKPILQLIENLLEDKIDNLKSEVVHTAFITLLLQIKRLAFSQHVFFDSQRFKDFHLFKKLIGKNYKHTHNANDYAKELNVSYKYLNEICKEVVNVTAKSFIDNWLLIEIKRTISEKKYTSQEIAFKMGFKEPSNFIRFFKRHTKITPLQFQNELNISTSVQD